MKFSRRLNALCDYIDSGEVVADIGCDHAQLCIILVASGKCDRVYACDVNEGPLMQAKKNIEYYKFEDKIFPCLSKGLQSINDDVTTVVIAGMGFETVQMILNEHQSKLIAKRKFIIQSNKNVEGLRRWISNHHFKIIKESVVFEEDHYYQIVSFVCDEDVALDDAQIRFGKQMQKDDIFYSMWKNQLSKYEKILHSLKEGSSRYSQVMKEMHFIYKEFGSCL